MRLVRISRSSWVKITSGNRVIHIDPGYAGYPQNQGLPASELDTKADLILLSHFHKDHLQPEAIKWLRNESTVIAGPASCVPRAGGAVTVVEPGDELTLKGMDIRVVHAYNTADGHSTRKVHRRGGCVGYVLSMNEKTIYHPGDTDLIPEMKDLGIIDVAFIPIGGTFVMDPGEAARAVLVIRPKIVIPIHEAKRDVSSFIRLVESASKTAVKFLQPGETFDIGNG